MFEKTGLANGRVIFRERPEQPKAARVPVTRVEPEPAEAVLTVIDFLEQLGANAFDLEGMTAARIRECCDSLAQTLRESLASGEPGQPDWQGLRTFVSEHRRRENRFVNDNLAGLRTALWTFIQGLSRAVTEDRGVDDQIESRLSRLRTAVHGEPVEKLREQVLETVTYLGTAIEERKKKQRERLRSLGGQLKVMRTELAQARQKMALDPLTRLYNRSALQEHLARMVDLSLFSGNPASLLMVDIDHFKQVNDTYSHQAGDAAIREVANCCVRAFPRKTDFVARYGGEEFAIVLADEPGRVARELGERLLATVRETPFHYREQPFSLTLSIGVAELTESDTLESWLERADKALYEAKHAGRDRVVVASKKTVGVIPG